MTRFLLCSFALVLLYPSGIDMYLVGLPRIAQDLGWTAPQKLDTQLSKVQFYG